MEIQKAKVEQCNDSQYPWLVHLGDVTMRCDTEAVARKFAAQLNLAAELWEKGRAIMVAHPNLEHCTIRLIDLLDAHTLAREKEPWEVAYYENYLQRFPRSDVDAVQFRMIFELGQADAQKGQKP